MNLSNDQDRNGPREHADNQGHWYGLLPPTPSLEATRVMDLDDQQMVRLEIGSASF